MQIHTHSIHNTPIAEVISENIIIGNAEEGLDVLGNVYYQGFDQLIVHAHQLTPLFFDLKTGIAGEILQKFSNYRVRLAIVGDFSIYPSKSLQDFIFESNQQGHIHFVESTSKALEVLSK